MMVPLSYVIAIDFSIAISKDEVDIKRSLSAVKWGSYLIILNPNLE